MSKAPSKSIILQERDIVLLRDLFESRIMTSAHIAAIHFDGKREMTKKRLQQLKSAGYIATRPRMPNEPAVLFLTRKGCRFLREIGLLSKYPPISLSTLERRIAVSDRTIRHELAVIDVKAAFYVTLRSTKVCHIQEFSTWPLLYQFRTKRSGYGSSTMTVKPDGFIRIQDQNAYGGVGEHVFFLEVDRSTETQDTLVSRACCYRDFYKSGGFAVRKGAPSSSFKDYPFRVLMVLQNSERMNNTAARLLLTNPSIQSLVWLTTFGELLADPLGAIWIRPVDYSEATNGMICEMKLREPTSEEKRQAKRDALANKSIKRNCLIQ